MGTTIEIAEVNNQKAVIKIFGVGGGGGNALNNMIQNGIKGVEFIAANTDLQALSKSLAPVKIQLGTAITGGRGSGGEPKIGAKAAYEDKSRIKELLKDADMIFIAAGMGGGTGTGAAPVIAEIAKEVAQEEGKDILVVSVVTRPFSFEGEKRIKAAEVGIRQLYQVSDAVIVVSNDNLEKLFEQKVTLLNAFKMADEVLYKAAQGIVNIIEEDGLVNLDFNDVKNILSNAGEVVMGNGYASGEKKLLKSIDNAINNILVEKNTIEKPKGAIINYIVPADLYGEEFLEAQQVVKGYFYEKTNVIFGLVIDETLKEDEARVTVIIASSKRASSEDDTTEETVSKKLINVFDSGTNDRTGTAYNFGTEFGTREKPREAFQDYNLKYDEEKLNDPNTPAYFRKYRDEL